VNAMTTTSGSFLAICGSRKPAASIDKPSAARELLHAVVQGMTEAGARPRWLDLRDLDLPHFDGRGVEEYDSADLTLAADAVRCSRVIVLSVPAYWAGPAGVVKNFLDLLGGPAYDAAPGTEPPLTGKVLALLVVGSDAVAGPVALGAMRQTLAAMGAWVLPRAEVVGDPRQIRNATALLASLKTFGAHIAGLRTSAPVRAAS
jgi:NAD(P)H-dependent FMN reductase